jgi:hypothetical protein
MKVFVFRERPAADNPMLFMHFLVATFPEIQLLDELTFAVWALPVLRSILAYHDEVIKRIAFRMHFICIVNTLPRAGNC